MGLLAVQRREQLADEPVGGLRCRRGVAGVESRHTNSTESTTVDVTTESSNEHAKCAEFSGGEAAWAGRSAAVCRAWLRSMPSRMAAISAGVTSTRSPLASGKSKTSPSPASCIQTAKPSRSQ